MAFVSTTALLLLLSVSRVLSARVQILAKDPELFVRTFLPGLAHGLVLGKDGEVKKVSEGQASLMGVKPGWTLAFVDDRPYSSSWLNQKASGKNTTTKYQQNFEPGTWDAVLSQYTGEVSMVYEGGQADKLGLKRGFKVTAIGGKALRLGGLDLIASFAKGQESYTVAFEENIISKPYMLTFVKDKLELPLPGDSGKCLWKGGLHTDLKCCCAQVCADGADDKCAVESRLFAAYFTGPVEIRTAFCSSWTPPGAQKSQVKARKKKCMTALDAEPGLLTSLEGGPEAALWAEFDPNKYDCQPLCEAMF
mmetsp:Transcript_33606/g.60837  ORF Transcript_33606/g.60837 Transcript_33606/m.60837 type:complete len:307 (-) Transcript_33606:97-1017(-)